ncbi:MAG: glycosyltransferase family 2 protein [Bacteroidetes bacterium]|nr:glycosyltransferase family 2 protein [Bacteroidota bacterium]MBU1580574.1 glycosyltransferase family 2 protein [Bacteroidota bacterium]MBU2466440.1 glycosyltransferase family 2 protein [Bacteroidota bacterium]MBU2558207.1 glycosyltransferase family 2 protein [Bacteroidota bacterium]
MDKLSVSIISFNEEKNIRRCLESVKTIADEIVVVDSFSTDKTEAICREFDVSFSKHPFEGYIEQKNVALKACRHNFVLSLDADEALSEELCNSILDEKKRGFKGGYSMNRLTNFCGSWIRHSGWYPDRKLRLFEKTSGEWGGKNPHDKFLFFDKNTVLSHLKGDLLHYSYYTIEQHIAQINKFSTIKAEGEFERGKKCYWIRLWLSPTFKFFRNYFFKLGFLDGFHGYVICRNSAHATFLKYSKLRELWKQYKQPKND